MPDLENAAPGVIGEHTAAFHALDAYALLDAEMAPIGSGAPALVPAPGPIAMAGVAMILMFGKRKRRLVRR